MRKEDEVDDSRSSLVNRWVTEVKAAEQFWKPQLDRMREGQSYARHGCNKANWDPREKYTVNLVKKHITNLTNAVYAKNPAPEVEVNSKIEYQYWDGDAGTKMMAQQALGQVGGDINMLHMHAPQIAMILQDIQQADDRISRLKKMGRTIEILFGNALKQNKGKQGIKGAVRRAATCGVAYAKVGYQREMDRRAEDNEANLSDARARLAVIERLKNDADAGDISESDAEYEELSLSIEHLQNEKEIILREGLTLTFPRSTAIIPDTALEDLNGFAGARWVAEKFMMTRDRIVESFDHDVSGYAKKVKSETDVRLARGEQRKDSQEAYTVYEIWDRSTGMRLVVCEGYPDFLQNPVEPDVFIEDTLPFFALTLNDVEDEEDPFPPSDVELLRHPQDEYNRARDGLADHRYANLPRWFYQDGAVSKKDAQAFASSSPWSVVGVKIDGTQDLDKVFKRAPVPGIDWNLYGTSDIMDDMVRAGGTPESSWGAMNANGSATEASIAEDGRVSAMSSAIDDLDMWLSDIAEASGRIFMREMSLEEVKRIAGPGAEWYESQTAMADMVQEVHLTIKAGSSGKPNRSKELAALERMMPFMMQMPEADVPKIWDVMLQALGTNFRAADFLKPGAPSIAAQNAMATGAGSAEGMQGGMNAPTAGPAPGGRTMPGDVQNNETRMG